MENAGAKYYFPRHRPHLQPNNNLLTLVEESNFEIYKIKNNMSTLVMSELFKKPNLNDNLRSQTDFSLHSVHTVA